MIKKNNNSGWILCPSKSYPGKFYYFNVLNGEAAWSLNDNVKKILNREDTIQKVKENHVYPEPVTPPGHQSPRPSHYHSSTRISLPKFGQVKFPKYISNVNQINTIMWTPIQMPQLVTNTKKMFDQYTQTEQNNINDNNYTFPLSKNFQYKINENDGFNNEVEKNQTKDWWNSTNIWPNIYKQSTSEIQYKRKLETKPFIRESKLKRLEDLSKKDVFIISDNQHPTQSQCHKVENAISTTNHTLNLDINDLRYVLRAKRKKSVEMRDLKKVNEDHSMLNNTKKVTFNIRDDNTLYSQKKYISEETMYKDYENQRTQYLVVDLDTLLDEYDSVKHYIDKENCQLYIPSAIQNKLKAICMGEHGGRSRVIVARQLLRHLGSNMPRLNLPENKEDTIMYQIINCCLEIMKLNYDVVLVTRDLELIYVANLHKIQVYHINDFKLKDLENNALKQNLFLQNNRDFDPFTISKIVREPENSKQYISGHNGGLFDYSTFSESVIHVSDNSDISDIIMNINKLNIYDKISNMGRRFKQNDLKMFFNTNNNAFISNKISQANTNMSLNKKTHLQYKNYNLPKPLNQVLVKATDNIFEDRLKEFYITDNIMEHNLYLRFEEWVCSYEQIIEDFLHIVLEKNIQYVIHPPPWFLHEGMICLKDIYKDDKYIVNIIEKLLHYHDFSTENGTNIKPYNFMKLFGCGFCLVEALEEISPLYILEIKEKLLHLRDMLEHPIEDLIIVSPRPHYTEDRHTYKYNFIKNPSYVLDYLKKYFIEWKNYNEDYNQKNEDGSEVHNDNIKVVRTFGRHLNKLTINKSKCLSFINETDQQTHKHDFYPKVIRNIQFIDTFEEKLKQKNFLQTEATESNCDIIKYDRENNYENNSRVAEINDFENVSLTNEDINDSTKDSGFGSNSLLAYSLVRNFLSGLSSSFKIIHIFIDESIKEYSVDITEESKNNLYEKTNKTHAHIVDIIEKLKIIIQRESVEGSTLKSLLIKAGSDDKRTTRYRSVVMKCLEQAKILESSLKLLLATIKEEVASESDDDNIHFINIYE